MIKNDTQMESPQSTKRVIKSRCENRYENRCKTAPSRGGSASTASPPLVVLSRHTLYLFLSIIFSTTNQTLKTARRHHYADARPDLWATASSADLPPKVNVAIIEQIFIVPENISIKLVFFVCPVFGEYGFLTNLKG